MKKICLIMFISVLVLVSCGEKEKIDQPSEGKSSTESPNSLTEDQWFHPEQVTAINLYSTSTVDNYAEFGPNKALDGDNSTYWKSRPGTGYGDGIMIELSKFCKITSIKVKQPDSDKFNRIESFELFINGIDRGIEESEFKYYNPVNAKYIYIRINSLNSTKSITEGKHKFTYVESPKPVAISEIIIKGTDNGNNIPSPLPLKILVPGKVKASSTLSPLSAYNADFLFDSSASFAWVEGQKSAGEGEELTFSFPEDKNIKGIILQPGYHRSLPHLESNAAPDKVEIYNGSKIIGTYNIINIDEVESSSDLLASWQYLKFPEKIKTSELKLKIISVRNGSRYKDLAISELAFIDQNNNILAIRSKNVSKFIKSNISKTKGTILENFIDKYLEVTNLPTSEKNSFLIRSNGSFVCTNNFEQNGNGSFSMTNMIMDGGWTLVSADTEKAVIKIFGKIMRQSEEYIGYEGTSSVERVVLFSDTITINADSIKGKKTIKSIPLTPKLFKQ